MGWKIKDEVVKSFTIDGLEVTVSGNSISDTVFLKQDGVGILLDVYIVKDLIEILKKVR
jgi:hypothetical protein